MILLIITTLTLGYQLDEKPNGGVTKVDEKNIIKQLDDDKKLIYEIIEVMDEKEEFNDEYYETEEHILEKKVLGFCGGSGEQVFVLLDQTEVSVTNGFYSL